jgi:hypothetical protein
MVHVIFSDFTFDRSGVRFVVRINPAEAGRLVQIISDLYGQFKRAFMGG